MDNPGYVSLTRQSGLMQEMQIVANNIANAGTTGFRREGSAFSEFVAKVGADRPTLSMGRHAVRFPDLDQGALKETGGAFDLAIQGDGFFGVMAPDGVKLTRAGAFTLRPDGELVTSDGYPVLDAGEAPIFIPPDASDLQISADGTISADNSVVGQFGLFRPVDGMALTRSESTTFATEQFEPVEQVQVVQGFVELSNVNPVREITRIIEVQRAYELGQKLMDQEHERIRSVMQTLTR